MYFSDKYVNYNDNYQVAQMVKERELEKNKPQEEDAEEKKLKEKIEKINEVRGLEVQQNALRAKAYTTLVEAYFLRGLANAYVKSLPLDEGAISENVLIKYFENALLENNVNVGNMMLKNRNNNRFLNTLYEDSKYLAGKNSDKLAEKNKLTKESVDEFLDDNKEEDDKVLSNNTFNEDEVTEVVKNKVIDTVKQEQEYAKKIKEEDDSINELKEKNESVRLDYGVNQHSIFKSLMICSTRMHNGTLNEDTGDKILCDAICEYTRLELFNTLNISSHSVTEIKNICESMLMDSRASFIY